jgi:hypothetical protein
MNKNYSNIDDLFRDKFKDFELYPPDHIWENIKQNVHGKGQGNKGTSFSKGGIAGITIILILTGIFTIYLLRNTSDKSDNTKINYNNQTPDNSFKPSPRSVSFPSLTLENNSEILENFNQKTSEPERDDRQKNHLSLTQETIVQSDIPNLNSDPELTDNINPVHSSFTEVQADAVSGNISELLALNETDETTIITDKNTSHPVESEINEPESIVSDNSISFESGSSSSNPEIRSDYGAKGNWSFGLFFTPEMMFYPSSSEFNNRSYLLDLNGIYRFSGYLIQSGIGVGWSSDDGNYKIDYNSYLGSYEDVYNVTFDTTGGQVIPIYHTETVQVYDTVEHVSLSPAKCRYTYLNIPLLFGYGNETKNFGWFIKAGPSLSLLIHENKADINLSDSQNKILNVENELPGRIKTNWQFVFTGGAYYKLNNQLSISLEPVFRYYIKSTYDQSKSYTKNPYSLGLRAGLILSF